MDFSFALLDGYITTGNNNGLKSLLDPDTSKGQAEVYHLSPDWFVTHSVELCDRYSNNAKEVSIVRLSYESLKLLNDKLRNQGNKPSVLIDLVWHAQSLRRHKFHETFPLDIFPLNLLNPEHVSKYKYCLELIGSDNYKYQAFQCIERHHRQELIDSKISANIEQLLRNCSYLFNNLLYSITSYYLKLLLIMLQVTKSKFPQHYTRLLNMSLLKASRIGDLHITKLLVNLGATNIAKALKRLTDRIDAPDTNDTEYISDEEFDNAHYNVIAYLKSVQSNRSNDNDSENEN
jgi:hypothetical protein